MLNSQNTLIERFNGGAPQGSKTERMDTIYQLSGIFNKNID